MSTFENGWICRECWSANREFDGRCYRCHAARPESAGVLTIEEVHPPEPESINPIASIAPEEAEHPAGGGEGAARPPGSFCLRCGHRLLDRAAYCTQCGMATGTNGAPQASAASRVEPAHTPPTPRSLRPANPLPSFERMRSAFNGFRARRELSWEAVMSTAAVLSTVAWLYADELPAPLNSWSHVLVSVGTAVFITEYAVRLLFARGRSAFARDHLLELAAIAPPLRAVRLARITWLVWIRPLVRKAPQRWSGLRLTGSARWPRAILAWIALLVAVTAATWAYAADGGVAGREPAFALLALLLSTCGGLTAYLVAGASSFSRTRIEDVPRNLRLLEELRRADLIDAAEFGSRREALLAMLTPAETEHHASPVRTREANPRVTSHTPA